MGYFQYKVPGDLIYPGTLKSKANLSIDFVYDLLEELRKESYLELMYELYCPTCHKSKGIFLKALTDWAGSKTCDFCNSEIIPLTDSIVLYRVLENNNGI